MRHFLIPLLICVVALAGCSSRKYVRSSVDSRTVDQAKVSPSAISIEAAPADGKNPLEHEEYRGLLARALESKGWTVVKSGSSVPYLKFAYKVDGGKVVGSTSYTFSSASASRSGGSIQAMGNSWETSSALISYNRYLGLRAYDAQGRVWWSERDGLADPISRQKQLWCVMRKCLRFSRKKRSSQRGIHGKRRKRINCKMFYVEQMLNDFKSH